MKKHISIILALLMLAGILAMPAQALTISENPAVDGGITATGTFTGSVTKESSVTGSWCDITAGNLSLDAMCYIYFGYETTDEMQNVDDYGVIFWTSEQEEGGYTYLNAAKTGSGALIRSKADGWSNSTDTYFNYGVSMKQMTDLVWGQGYYIKGDTVYTSSKVVEYSVQTYAGNKLGILNGGKNETDNQKLKTLLKSLLQTGAAAQEYLDYKTYDLASDILKWSEGLEYYSYGDGTCCVYGIGTCSDADIFIPKFSPDGDEVIAIDGDTFADSNDDTTYNDSITSVVIPTSVLYIGDCAFMGCTNLADIRIHDKVEWIGEAPFYGTAFYEGDGNWTGNALYLGNCIIAAYGSAQMPELAIKDGTTVMADGAFDGTSLTKVTIPASMTAISLGAFYGCTSLEEVVITENSKLQYINSEAFRECSALKTIDISGASELQTIYSEAFCGCTSLETITFPAGLKNIYSQAFYGCTSLDNVTIHEGLSIDYSVFYGCTGLNTINLPDSWTYIDSSAFGNTGYYNNSENWSYKTDTDGNKYDRQLSIGNYFIVARDWTSATLEMKEGPLFLADGCFNSINHEVTTSLTLPSTLKTYISGSLNGLRFQNIAVAAGNEHFYAEGNCLIEKTTGTVLFGTDSAIIPTDSSITAIGEDAFSYSGMTAITIPDNIKVIGTCAFEECGNLTTVTISESSALEYIYEGAFYNCQKLVAFTFPKTLKYIGDGAFDSTSIGSIILPDGLTYLGDYAFNCIYGGISVISIPSSIEYIGIAAAMGLAAGSGGFNGVKSISIGTNTRYQLIQDCLVDTDTKTLIMACNKSVIPTDGSVTAIADNAFEYRAVENTAIVIPDCVTTIGTNAFKLSNIESITLGSGITEIEEGTFAYCDQLTSITIPDNVTSIGYGAFMFSGLKSITIPSSVTKISSAIFSNTQLTSICYEGTEEQWNSIKKDSYWNQNCNTYTIIFPTD